MTEGNVNKTVNELTIEQWLQVRKEEGRKTDTQVIVCQVQVFFDVLLRIRHAEAMQVQQECGQKGH